MILFPPAKINLGLNVLSKREDGYHEIETCMVAIPMHDVLEILPSEEFSFRSSGLLIGGNQEDNLCVKAYSTLKKRYNIPPVQIHLLKNIPMGAGLGGGSADATYVLKGLNELFDLKISNDELREIASELGSDCPFFVEETAQIAKGRGELLNQFPLNVSGLYLKIINPGIHVGTAEAYAGVEMNNKSTIESHLNVGVENWKTHLSNSFENSIFKNHAEIKEVKNQLYDEGAIYAAMSGSGSTVFGLFYSEPSLTSKYDFVRVYQL